jgi:hypothetical protein
VVREYHYPEEHQNRLDVSMTSEDVQLPADPGGPPESARTRLTGGLCQVCQAPLTGRQATACSPRCRAALSRQRAAAAQAQATTTAADVDVLRQHVAELQVTIAALRQENQGLRQRNEGLLNLLASFKRQRVSEQQSLIARFKRQWQTRRR